VAQAKAAGVAPAQVLVDPGIGFGKTREQNLELLARLGELRALGRPLLLGTSRKSVIGLTLGLPPDQREEGTGATVALGIRAGANVVRVHDVRSMSLVARMADAIVRGTPGGRQE
jgi:dihydropteroate synthase